MLAFAEQEVAAMHLEGSERFVLYKDAPAGELIAPRQVVQFDSISRVADQPFDVFMIDETGSVVSHTCSTLIRDPAGAMQAFRHHLAKAKRVMLLDAHLDDFPGYNFVQSIERLMGVDACWVRNRFIRPPGYTATLHVCKSGDRDVHQNIP
jgi:hypothetical protein